MLLIRSHRCFPGYKVLLLDDKSAVESLLCQGSLHTSPCHALTFGSYGDAALSLTRAESEQPLPDQV